MGIVRGLFIHFTTAVNHVVNRCPYLIGRWKIWGWVRYCGRGRITCEVGISGYVGQGVEQALRIRRSEPSDIGGKRRRLATTSSSEADTYSIAIWYHFISKWITLHNLDKVGNETHSLQHGETALSLSLPLE